MRKKTVIAALSLAFAMTAWTVSPVMAADSPAESDGQSLRPAASEMLENSEYKPDELIVTFDDQLSKKKIESIVEAKDAEVERIAQGNSEEKVVQVTIAEGDSMEEAIQKFQQDGRVTGVQPNYRYQVKRTADPFLSKESGFYQYINDQIHAEDAWTFLENGAKKAKTRIAVLDTGVDTGHEDLQANLLLDNGAYIRTLGGKEIRSKEDSGDHGTHVSGIIGATYGNGKGGSGAAAGHNNDLVEVMMVGTSPDGMYLYTFDVVSAVNYAIDHDARVISMSFGLNARDRVEEKVMIEAYQKGIVLVAASGNEDFDGYSAPGSMKEVIGVNASAPTGEPAYYSNYGYSSDIMAPGSNIWSTIPGDEYSSFSGTSMACPVVSAVAAMMLDANPDLTPQQVYNIMCTTTGQEDFDREGKAYGLVNADAAVQAAAAFNGDVPCESLYLKEKEEGVTLLEGDDYGLEALVRPAAAMPEFTWESSDDDVATVTDDGRVIGISEGTCEITVRAGGKEQSCTVTVKPAVKVESIELSGLPEDGEIAIDEAVVLNTRLLPTNASNGEVYYKSSDPNVAFVDEEGIVSGISEGTAVITAYAFVTPSDYLKGDDPTVEKVSSEVTIKVKNAATRASVSGGYKWVFVGSTVKYTGKLMDSLGRYGDRIAHNKIEWSVNDTALASINKNTGSLTAKKAGTVYIIATQALQETSSSFMDDLESVPQIKATKKLIIAKKNYKGKTDYALKATVSKKKKNQVKLTWKTVPIATGYQIQFASKKNGTYKTVKTIKSGTIKKAVIKTKKTGYYRIRARYVAGGKTKWFGFSNIVKGKPYTKKK